MSGGQNPNRYAQAIVEEVGRDIPTYLDFLQSTAELDVAGLQRAEASYGDSWKRRGGVGAFMMLARKWDRIENAVGDPSFSSRYDIFKLIEVDSRAEGIIDDIRDLRRYLLLVEAEMIAQGHAREEVSK